MEIRELHAQHLPATLAFVEVAVQDYVLLLALICFLPCSHSRTHRVQVGYDESPSWPQRPKYFVIVCLGIWQIALIEVRNGQVETVIINESQVLRIANTI